MKLTCWPKYAETNGLLVIGILSCGATTVTMLIPTKVSANVHHCILAGGYFTRNTVDALATESYMVTFNIGRDNFENICLS